MPVIVLPSYVASFSQFEGCWISPNLSSALRIKNRLEFEYSELSFQLACLADCFPEYPWQLQPRQCLPLDAIQIEQRNFEWTGDGSRLPKRIDCRDGLPAQNPKATTRSDCACVVRAGNMPELANRVQNRPPDELRAQDKLSGKSWGACSIRLR